jgi:hypothetical protein
MLTISRRTSPVENASPSFFFHEAIPPSVIVGLIAGILNCAREFLRVETWKPGKRKMVRGRIPVI